MHHQVLMEEIQAITSYASSMRTEEGILVVCVTLLRDAMNKTIDYLPVVLAPIVLLLLLLLFLPLPFSQKSVLH